MESVQLARVADLGDMTQRWFWDSADPVTNQPSGWVWLDRTARGTERRYIQKSDADKKNYGTRDSRMVTHCSTNLAISCLTGAERTGSRVFMIL
jgi:hypothetical protein